MNPKSKAGFIKAAKSLGADVSDEDAFVAAEQERVFARFAPGVGMSYTIEGSSGTWEIVVRAGGPRPGHQPIQAVQRRGDRVRREPNSQVSFVDAAFPGMLPVLNGECVAQAVRTGLGLNARINLVSRFDRKNYFYADLPAGYQISQFEHPIVGAGEVEIELADGSSAHRRHPPAPGAGRRQVAARPGPDALLHRPQPLRRGADGDRQRARHPHARRRPAPICASCAPICAISAPATATWRRARMRADVNVSVRQPGEPFRTRCEVKNVNSIRFVMQAIEAEAQRQVAVWEGGGTVRQETRLFDPARNETRSMRSKEDAHDYRYFPDPDLLPLVLDAGLGGRAARGLAGTAGRQARAFHGRVWPAVLRCRRAGGRAGHGRVLRDGGARPRRQPGGQLDHRRLLRRAEPHRPDDRDQPGRRRRPGRAAGPAGRQHDQRPHRQGGVRGDGGDRRSRPATSWSSAVCAR